MKQFRIKTAFFILCACAALACGSARPSFAIDEASTSIISIITYRTPGGATETLRAEPAAEEPVLSARSPSVEKSFSAGGAGESWIRLRMSSPDTSWKTKGNKGAVLKVYANGKWTSDVIVYGGAEKMEYSAYIGRLETGMQKVRIELDPKLSPAKDPHVRIHDYSIDIFSGGGDVDSLAARFAPLVYVRDGDPTTDIPLILLYYAREDPAANETTLEYTVIYTNEDGGTGKRPSIEYAQYGRMIDTEWIYKVTLDSKTLAIKSEKYQAAEHKEKVFTGKKEGLHPLIRVATDNGNFAQEGTTAERLGLEPYHFTPALHSPEESIMELFPWTYRVMNEEMYSEDKVGPGPYKVGDARDYVYFDVDAKNNGFGRSLEFLVKLKGGGEWFSSDPGVPSVTDKDPGKTGRSGLLRAAVRLPALVCGDVEKIGLRGSGAVDYEVKYLRAFCIDENFKPLPFFFEHEGRVHVTPSKRMVEFDARK